MNKRRRRACRGGRLAVLLWTLTTPLAAGDWPGWRGPDRDGSLGTEWNCPTWPAELERRWQITAGSGHASPIVSDERVFLFSREGENEVVRALDLATGEERWRQSYPVAFKSGIGSGKHGIGPKSTPTVAEGRLFTLGIAGALSAWDAAGGRLLWRLDAGDRFEKGSPPYGSAASPLVYEGRVIVHQGGKSGGALLALDVATGNEIWSWQAESPGYASPVAVELEGSRQIVTQSRDSIVAVEASSGRVLWRIPFASSMSSHNVVTPLPLDDGSLVLSGRRRGLWAVRPSPDGESWRTDELWRNDKLSTELSSPVAEGGRIFGLAPTKKGQLFALDAATGKPIWITDGRDAENVALLTAPGVVLVLTVEGELWVLDAKAPTMERLASYEVSEQGWVWAHPAIVDDRIVIKDRETLALWVLDCGSY